MKRWLHMAVLATIVALLANSQCYARCLASVSIANTSDQHSSCHQSSHSKQGNHSRCDYDRHSETATTIETKVIVDQGPVLYFSPVACAFSPASALRLETGTTHFPDLPQRASPPHKPLFLAISVFRL